MPTDLAPDLRARCESALADHLDRQRTTWPDPAVLGTLRRFVLAGGKRLRPMFCYWGWRGAGGEDSPEIVTAAALELFHAFALVHDDIMDGSDLRRGEPSVHRSLAEDHHRQGWRGDPGGYGAGAALLVGDLLAAWADRMFAESGCPPAGRSSGVRCPRPAVDTARLLRWMALTGPAGTVLGIVRI